MQANQFLFVTAMAAVAAGASLAHTMPNGEWLGEPTVSSQGLSPIAVMAAKVMVRKAVPQPSLGMTVARLSPDYD